ncbi:MAG: phenylalanine--tRNA ligase subunit alpha, partial [Planctomycetaceae bacterium]|nr:phenylalanine--tRNA ligase subunit alpha [Planctomycetaceae bacterium]
MDILQSFDEFEAAALTAIAAADGEAAVEQVRIAFMGQKNGRIRDLQKLVGKAAPDQKPVVGKRFNEVRTRVTAALEERQQALQSAVTASGADFDVTLPG